MLIFAMPIFTIIGICVTAIFIKRQIWGQP